MEILNLGNEIRATYNEKTIRVYQAYNEQIANELLELKTFGSSFSMTRMTWIKPSFLWMMYRSGWGSKENQTRVIAFDITIREFNELLKKAVLSSYNECYGSIDNWKNKLKNAEVICQWDPEKDIFGKSLSYKSIQIGIRGKTLNKYINEAIVNICDVTEYVKKIKNYYDKKEFEKIELPKENTFKFDI